jgi:hypothetical protein
MDYQGMFSQQIRDKSSLGYLFYVVVMLAYSVAMYMFFLKRKTCLTGQGNGNQGTKLHYLHNRHAPAHFGSCEFNLDLSLLPAFLGPRSSPIHYHY